MSSSNGSRNRRLGAWTLGVFLFAGFGMVVPQAKADGLPLPAGWRLVDTQGFHPSPREAGSVFTIPGESSFGVFGGYSEAVDLSGTTAPSTNTFFDDLFVFHAPSRTWSRRSAGTGPAARGFACAVYHPASDRVLVFGGTDFAADFSAFTFYDDLWTFDLGTNSWTELSPSGPRPSGRGGFGCGLLEDSIYVFSGNGPGFSTDNELWRYDIDAGSWTLLQADDAADSSRPRARTGMLFERVPGKDQFLMTGGDTFDPFPVAVTLEDAWLYDAGDDSWQELATRNKPEPARTSQAATMVSRRYLWVQNGNAQGDLTGDDVCPAPLICPSPPVPTNDSLVYDIRRERWIELDPLFGSVPPTRRSMIAKVGNRLYLLGGYSWDGVNGVGKIPNPYTWELKLGHILRGH